MTSTRLRGCTAGALAAWLVTWALPTAAVEASADAPPTCAKPLYLTFDTGHMGVAPLVAEVLARQQVKASFFMANEATLSGGSSLDAHWARWWKARAQEGHLLASHTLDHAVWRGDLPDGRFRIRATAGPRAGVEQVWTAQDYCAELRRPDARLREWGGPGLLPLFRTPGGKTSAALLAAAQACGFAHVGWAPAGFLGDELPSDRYPNTELLRRALRDIRPGDILVAHLGIWSRKEPWAPAVLEPLIEGLKHKGYCFATLREHPDYRLHLQTYEAAQAGRTQLPATPARSTSP